MEQPNQTARQDPFEWPHTSRQDWTMLMTHRRRARLYLFLSYGPYLIGAGMVAIGFTGRDSDHAAWLGTGAVIFGLFCFMLPFWVPMCLKEWWGERKQVQAWRRGFWQRYKVDPFELGPPPEVKRPRAPWE